MSIKTRKDLTAIVAELNAKSKKSLSAKEALCAEMTARFSTLKALDAKTPAHEVKAHMDSVREAINNMNAELQRERIEALAKMDFKEAWADYMRDQSVTGYSLSVKGSEYTLDAETVVKITAYDFVCEICPTEKNGIVDACTILCDNIAKWKTHGDTGVALTGMHASYAEMKKRMGWDFGAGELSKTKLVKQLNDVAKMVSGGLAPNMIAADVTFIAESVISTNDIANSAGVFIKRNEATIVNYVFRAIYTRVNGMAYIWQDKGRGELKGSTTPMVANKEMGEAPAKEFKPSPAGEVTVSVEEKPKAKKSTKAKKPEETAKTVDPLVDAVSGIIAK